MSSTPPDPAPEGSSDWLTRARHIFFGTAATFVEMLEDPQKREENWGKMSMDLNDLAEELAAKGQITEAEAIRQIQEQQRQNQADASSSTDDRHAPGAQQDQEEQQDHPPQSPRQESPDRGPERSSSSPQPTPEHDPADVPNRTADRSAPTTPPPRSQASSQPASTPTPAPDPPTQPQGEPVSADDISALMDLTREVERLRRDLEEKRSSRSEPRDTP